MRVGSTLGILLAAAIAWPAGGNVAAADNLGDMLQSFKGHRVLVLLRGPQALQRVGQISAVGDDYLVLEVANPASQPNIIPFTAILYIVPQDSFRPESWGPLAR